jgi:2-methylisocitrate lyase-like PEP mutase family enzyme
MYILCVSSTIDAQARRAEYFRWLHRGPSILILPNAWDVPTARIFEDAGFKAVATTSAGVTVSLGYEDGQIIPKDEFLAAIKRIARVLTVPLTVDLVAGFGQTVDEVVSTVRRVVEAGAVGLNIEDFEHQSKQLFDLEQQVLKIKAIKTLGEQMGVPIVVNARTDALRYAEGGDDQKFKEAVRRAEAYRDAGADCVYPMGLVEPQNIRIFVEELRCPVNVMVTPKTPSVRELETLGVKRLSFGPSAIYAVMGYLKRAAKEVLEEGTFTMLVGDALTYDELNRLTHPRNPS